VIAVDTNVIVRLIISDDQDQRRTAEGRLPEGFFVSHTVLMEVEWVLRSAYRMTRDAINGALNALLELDEIHTPKFASVVWALDRHAAGADFADMLHLISARGSSAFVTFDQALVRAAGSDLSLPVELLR